MNEINLHKFFFKHIGSELFECHSYRSTFLALHLLSKNVLLSICLVLLFIL